MTRFLAPQVTSHCACGLTNVEADEPNAAVDEG